MHPYTMVCVPLYNCERLYATMNNALIQWYIQPYATVGFITRFYCTPLYKGRLSLCKGQHMRDQPLRKEKLKVESV